MKKKCIIPARSGSKGLPNKNILEIDNKPLIQHTIEAAINSKLFEVEDIFLSTDSIEYYNLVKHLGISLHLRGEQISGDNSPSSDFILDFIENKKITDDTVLFLLQPTSPNRGSKNIIEAYEVFSKKSFPVVSICKSDKSPRLLSEFNNGSIGDLCGIDKGYARQKQQAYYYPNGAIYISKVGSYLTNKSFFTEESMGYLMDKVSSIDIDDAIDFQLAKIIMEKN